jgi:hypothetical protein
MPNTEADAIVQKVQHQLETPGRNAEAHAYTVLLDELSQYKEHNGACAANALTGQLEQSGILPKIAVGWLQNDYDKISTYKDEIGISKGEVEDYTHRGGSTKADLDAMLATQLLKDDGRGTQFDNVANRNWLGADPDLIEKADLRAYDRQDTRQRNREERHEGVRDVAAPLFEGSPPLIAILDASHNGECNGRISGSDLRRFLTACEVNNKTENAGTGPYTPENYAYVTDLLDGKYPELTGEGSPAFSARSLARRAGLDHVKINSMDDYAALAAEYVGKTSAKNVEQAAVSTTETNPCDIKEQPKETCVEEAAKPTPPVDHSEVYKSVDELSHYRKGEGQWHVAKRLLNAGNDDGDKSASNKDVWHLTKDILSVDGTKSLDAKGRSHPIVHPGDDAPVLSNIDKLFAQNPKLAESIFRLEKKNVAAAAKAQAPEQDLDMCDD